MKLNYHAPVCPDRPMFDSPSFNAWNIGYTAVGAAIFWGRWGHTKLRAYVLSDLLDMIPIKAEIRVGIEFVIFLALGVFVGIGITSPTNATQAIAAGLGWTGLLAKK